MKLDGFLVLSFSLYCLGAILYGFWSNFKPSFLSLLYFLVLF